MANILKSAEGLVQKTLAALSTKEKVKEKSKAHDDSLSLIDLDEKESKKLLEVAERIQLASLLPDLAGKRVLYLTPLAPAYNKVLANKNAGKTILCDVARTELKQHEGENWLRGTIDSLPFKDASFNFAFYPSALTWRSDLSSLIPELSRCLADGSRMVFSCVHPFFEYMSTPKLGYQRSIENIYRVMKKSGMFVEELKEGTLEEALKYVRFSPERLKELKSYRKLPLILAFRGLRIKKRRP